MATYREILESILIEKPVPYNPNIHTKSGNAVLDKKGNKIGSYSKNKAGKAVVKPLKAKPDKEKSSPEKEPEKTKSSPKKEPEVSKPTGKVRETVPKQKEENVRKGYEKVQPSINNQISKIDDPKTKETAEDVQNRMEQFINAETDEEKEEIVRYLADNNLIQTNTEDPKASKHKIYFDTVLTGLDRKTLGDGNATTREMWRILHEKQISVPFRGSAADRALADMSGKHNESGMVLLLCPEGSPSYDEAREIHEGNKKSYSGLGGNEREAHQRNIDMANEIKKTIPEGAKINDAKNTGGIGADQLGELYNINNKIDATDLIVFYQPPNPDPSVEVPSIKELEKKLNKKLKDMTPEDLAERDELVKKRYGGMRKVSAKTYSDPTNITVKNSGVRAGSEYLNDSDMDEKLVSITKNPEYNYQEEGISKQESNDRKKAMKRDYMATMEDKMVDMAKTDEGQKQLLDMWRKAHGCGSGVYTSVSNKKTGESVLHDPDHYCNPKMPFTVNKNDTSITISLDDNGEDALQLDLKTEATGPPKLLMRHLVGKGKKKKTEQYESFASAYRRVKSV